METNFFTQSLKDHTILWLFLTSIIGGIIGAAIKILSDNIVSQNITLTRQAREHFYAYSFKLLKAAKNLDKRLDFIVTDRKIHSQEEVNSKISFYYAVGNYLGWCKIIQEDAIDKFRRLPRTVEKFNIAFVQTLKGISSSYYFKGFSTHEAMVQNGAVIPNYCHTAISDLMLANVENNKTIVKSPVLSFSEFCEKYNSNEEMRRWFEYVERLLRNIDFNNDNLNWNRFLVISINLKVLIYQLDKFNKFTVPYTNLPHLGLLHENVLDKVKSDMVFLKSKKISVPQGFNYIS